MKDKLRILATTSIFHALNDGSVAVIPILFPILKSLFDLSYTQVGIITGGGLLLTLVSQLLIGRIADKKDFRTLLSLGTLLVSASLLLITQSGDFLTLLLFILFIRFASSFFHPVGVGWISRTFKKVKLDWAMGIQSGCADIGGFFAVATTLFMAETTYWQLPLFIWSIFGIIGLFIGLILTHNINENIPISINKKKQSIKDAFKEGFMLLKNIKTLVPAIMIGGAAWGIVITYLPLLLVERTNLSLSIIGIMVAIWLGIGSIASFSYGKISMHLGRKKTIILSYLTIGIIGLLLTIITDVLILILMMILLGISVFLTYPTLFSFISEVTHESIEGRTFGMTFTLQLGGGTALLFLGGYLSDVFGIWIPFFLLGSISIVVTILLLLNYKKPYANIIDY
jgi:FSR family fosmidomycin resistance protein-like MFS transporter